MKFLSTLTARCCFGWAPKLERALGSLPTAEQVRRLLPTRTSQDTGLRPTIHAWVLFGREPATPDFTKERKSYSFPPVFRALLVGLIVVCAPSGLLCAQRIGDQTPIVRFDPSIPTQRALAARIQEASASRLRLEPTGTPSSERLQGRRLDLTGRVSDPTLADPKPRQGHLLLSLEHAANKPCLGVGVDRDALLRCAVMALPKIRRVAVLYARGQVPTEQRSPGGGLEIQAMAITRAEDLRAICFGASAFKPDLVLINEGAGLDALASKLLARAASLRVPVATNIPWLANSGSTIAVTPRIDTLAIALSHWLTSTDARPFHWPGVDRRTINLSRLAGLRRSKEVVVKAHVLAAFDVVLRPQEGLR